MITNSFTRFREKIKPNTKKDYMPDFTFENFWKCESLNGWEIEMPGSEEGIIYIVSWSRDGHKNPNVQYDFACTCPDYEFRGPKLCKHIKAAMKYHCAWSEFVEGGEPIETDNGYRCPKCGGPLDIERQAV